MNLDLITEQLNTSIHERDSFDCGVTQLNVFLKQHANQNQIKNISKTYVAVVAVSPKDRKKIYGYYSLSASHISCNELSENLKNKLPKYPIPVARLAKLAVDKNYNRQGIGGFLLHDAFCKVLKIADQIGVYAVVVDAKNEEAKAFYQAYGFIELQTTALKLFLPIKTIKSSLE